RTSGEKGGVGKVVEYYRPGLDEFSAMERFIYTMRHARSGATGAVFPSDEEVKRFLKTQGRGKDWIELKADEDATYDIEEELNLSELEPLIAKPSSPGNVVAVTEVAGSPIYQSYIGSSANPGYRDFAIAAEMVAGKKIASNVSLDINPSSR